MSMSKNNTNSMKPSIIVFSDEKSVANSIRQKTLVLEPEYYPSAIGGKPPLPYSDLDNVLKLIRYKYSNKRIIILFDYRGFNEQIKENPNYQAVINTGNVTVEFFGYKTLEKGIYEGLEQRDEQSMSQEVGFQSNESQPYEPQQVESQLYEPQPSEPQQVSAPPAETLAPNPAFAEQCLKLSNAVKELKSVSNKFTDFLKDRTIERGIQTQLRDDISELSIKLKELKRIEKLWVSSISDYMDSLLVEITNDDLNDVVRDTADRHLGNLLEFLSAVKFEIIQPVVGEEWKKDSGIVARFPEYKNVDRSKPLIIQEIQEYGYKYGDVIIKKATVIVDNPPEFTDVDIQNEISDSDAPMSNPEEFEQGPDYPPYDSPYTPPEQ